jgi:methionine-rich copper-binding protein CopC
MGRTALAHTLVPTHAKVLSAVPAIGSTITQAPTTVTVNTAENINPDPKKSNLFVYSPAGDLISQGNAQVSFTNPRQMSITIKPTGDGIYVVQWITVSAADGDADQGAFVLTVKSTVTATPTPVSSQNTSPPASTPGTGGTPLWVPIVVGILALLVGLGGGLGIGRRSRMSSLRSMRKAVAAEQEEEAPTKRP